MPVLHNEPSTDGNVLNEQAATAVLSGRVLTSTGEPVASAWMQVTPVLTFGVSRRMALRGRQKTKLGPGGEFLFTLDRKDYPAGVAAYGIVTTDKRDKPLVLDKGRIAASGQHLLSLPTGSVAELEIEGVLHFRPTDLLDVVQILLLYEGAPVSADKIQVDSLGQAPFRIAPSAVSLVDMVGPIHLVVANAKFAPVHVAEFPSVERFREALAAGYSIHLSKVIFNCPPVIGMPAADMRIGTLSNQKIMSPWMAREEVSGREFSAILSDGVYRVDGRPAGSSRFGRAAVVVQEGSMSDFEWRDVLPGTHTLTVRVEGPDGKAVPSKVAWSHIVKSANSSETVLQPAQGVVRAQNGLAVLEGLVDGDYRITVSDLSERLASVEEVVEIPNVVHWAPDMEYGTRLLLLPVEGGLVVPHREIKAWVRRIDQVEWRYVLMPVDLESGPIAGLGVGQFEACIVCGARVGYAKFSMANHGDYRIHVPLDAARIEVVARVVDATGNAMRDVSVRLRAGTAMERLPHEQAVTDRDGWFSIIGPLWGRRVEIQVDGQAWRAVDVIGGVAVVE